MSCWCQFCDKEMMFEAQATHTQGFITCGQTPCVMKAKAAGQERVNEERAKQMKQNTVCIFATKTPEDMSTWRILKPEDHPELVHDPKVLAQMIEGYIVSYLAEDDGDTTYYCAKAAKDVHKDVAMLSGNA